MSPEHRALLTQTGAERGTAIEQPSRHDYALLEELGFVRREAQAEADIAYAEWRDRPSAEAYAVYRAAQDRADAAQDDLASMSQRLAA
jgi:hypothetical protein